MEAGNYWVGDLCYLFSDEEWEEFLSLTINKNECLDGEFTLRNGKKFCTFSTKWGDGGYYDQFGNEYGVDAGLIGACKYEGSRPPSGGHMHFFEKDFVCSGNSSSRREWDGVIKIGHVHIVTDPESSEDEYEPEDQYDE